MQDFISFGSPEAPAGQHSERVGFGILEGRPHNTVHLSTGALLFDKPDGSCATQPVTNLGGFMQNNLSPVDPLFFLHHSNLDRLWDVWTRAGGTVPDPNQYPDWAKEPFLFFADVNGAPISATAGDYATIGSFAYDYQRGTGVSPPVAPSNAVFARVRAPVRRFAAEAPPPAGPRAQLQAAPSAVRLRPAVLQEARAADRVLVAKVKVMLPAHRPGQNFVVMVHAGNRSQAVEAGRIVLFGHTGHPGPLTFTVPVGQTIARLARRNLVRPNGFLHFVVVSPAGAAKESAAGGAARDLPIQALTLEAH